MTKLRNIHPGEILAEDFLKPMNITPYRLAKDIGVDQGRISEILNGKRAVTTDTALRLAAYFGTTPRLWLNLQTSYDIEETQDKIAQELASIPRRETDAALT